MNTGGCTIWITGLPASGKNTLANEIAQALTARSIAHEVIDSGKIRETLLGDTLGFTREERDANCRRNAFVASLLAKNGLVAVVSSVSPYRATRDALREELGRFLEVWVSTPKEVCIDQDQKGLWAKALKGEIRRFTGVDDPYEAPEKAEIEVDLSREEVGAGAARVVQALEQLGYIPTASESGVSTVEPSPLGFGYSD